MTDLTDRHAEVNAQEATESLCAILEMCECPAFCVDADGRIVGANLKVSEELGREREKLLGRHARNIDPRLADWPRFFAELQASSHMHLEPVFEGTDPRVSSRAIHARLWQPDGRVLAVLALKDVRNDQSRQAAMESRDAILQTVSRAATRYLADEDWDDSCNQLLKDLGESTGVSRVYIFEAHFEDENRLLFSQRYEWVAPGITPEIDNPELQNLNMQEAGYGRWLDLLSRGQLVAGQVRDFPASERELLQSQSIVSIAVVPIFTGNKWWGMMGFDECTGPREWGVAETEALRTVAGLFGLATERREVARLARVKRDTMAHEARLVAMGEMASGVAHEINQPLSAISNYCESGLAALHAENLNTELFERALRGAAAQAHRAGEIIRRLREFVRKGDTTRSLVDLNELVSETIELVDFDARARNVVIVNECQGELPQVNVCRIQIQQVLFNLLRNGMEAIEENEEGRERRIAVSSQPSNSALVQIDIVDSGPGIDPHQAAWIFEPFESSKPEGMGLGLSISRSIMEAHGGALDADPSHERGARFRITIPCLVDDELH